MTARNRRSSIVNEEDTFILNDIIKFTSEFRVKNMRFDSNNRDGGVEEFLLNSPSIVELNIKKPNGSVETFTYDTIDGDTTNNASSPNNVYNIFDNGTGIFCIEYQLNYPGTWWIRWEGKRDDVRYVRIEDIDPFGISVTSNRIYVVELDGDRVYVYDYNHNRHISEEFTLHSNNTAPKGISVLSNRAYVVDGFDDRIYVYDLFGNNIGDEEFNLTNDNDAARGVAVTPYNRIYVVDNNNKVFVYDYGGHLLVDDGFDLNVDNDTPSGIIVTTNRIYVVDNGIDDNYNIYVYNLEGNRQEEEEFNLTRTNSIPQGVSIYSNYMYIVDRDSTKAYIYVYDLNGNYQPDRSFSLLGSVPHNAVGAAERSLRVVSSSVLG